MPDSMHGRVVHCSGVVALHRRHNHQCAARLKEGEECGETTDLHKPTTTCG